MSRKLTIAVCFCLVFAMLTFAQAVVFRMGMPEAAFWFGVGALCFLPLPLGLLLLAIVYGIFHEK